MVVAFDGLKRFELSEKLFVNSWVRGFVQARVMLVNSNGAVTTDDQF